jgi:hypothetical protein
MSTQKFDMIFITVFELKLHIASELALPPKKDSGCAYGSHSGDYDMTVFRVVIPYNLLKI